MIDLSKPGMHFINMLHDYGCPAIDSQSAFDCQCNAEITEVSEQAWLKGVELGRKQRRKAAREAAKALRKIKGAK